MRIHSVQPLALATWVALVSCASPRAAQENAALATRGPTVSGSATQEASVVTSEGLELSLSLVGGAPGPGVPLTLQLTALNPGATELAVNFSNGQRYDFEILAADGGVVWHWADDMMFTMALGREMIGAGESLEWQETLATGLPAGAYRVVGTLASMEPVKVELALTIED